MITFIDNRLTVETATQTAVFENGCLCSLISKLDGKTYLSCRPDAAPMSIVFVQDHVYPMDNGTIETRKLSDTQAEVIVHSWYGDGVIRIGVDEPTGDVLVRPSAYADRPGVKGLRYDIRGIAADLEAVLPVYQGVRLRQDDPLLVGQVFPWPNGWEAGFAIYEGADAAGFWLHCQDDRFNFKTLYCGEPDDPYRVGLACIAHGPLDDNTSAGSVTWRLNVFTGGWRVPAQRYKDWLWNAYGLEQQRRKRPDWLYDLKFAVSFSRADIGVLRALEKWVDPKKVLVHVSSWRTDGYDQNYPTYNANPAAQEMFRYGREKGFHIMPHTNSMQIDPGHPAYLLLQNQALRDLDTKKVVGWAYNHELWLKTDQPVDVPYSTYARVQPYNRKANIMPTIHCGCSMWHSVLREQIQHIADDYGVDACFVDVVFGAANSHNGLVEGRSHAEGALELLRYLSEINGGLLIGGENANELTAQGQGIGQMHLYQSWHFSKPGLERTGGDVAVGDFLYGELCRMYGYAAIGGRDENERMRMRVHADHNCIPTVDSLSAEELEHPNKAVKALLEAAGA